MEQLLTLERLEAVAPDKPAAPRSDLRFLALPMAARIYIAVVTIAGMVSFVALVPRSYPQPMAFLLLLIFACLTSTWKVNLPISLASGSTLSVSYAANLTALLLLGPSHAMVIAVAGTWMQCTYKVKQPYPLYRTAFSMAAETNTMAATGLVYQWLGGSLTPVDFGPLARPLVGAISTYFFLNTLLVAGAIASSTRQSPLKVWREEFLWSGVTFMVAGAAGAVAAVVIDRGEHWKAILMIAPVYLTYRTYELFVGRLEDQKRHVLEIQRLHQKTIDALTQTRQAEQALASEKERLAATLADMTRLEEARNQLLGREQAARASAEQANQLKDQFLSIVSHELRTPLTAMLGWADMLRRGTVDDARRQRTYEVIFNSAQRQSQLIDDLLDVGRIVSGKLKLESSVVSLGEVLRSALQLVQPVADAKRVQLTVHDEDVAPVYGDTARLQQVVWNLLSNAIKFTPAGGTVDVHLRTSGNNAEMIVTDSGAGIAPAFLPFVFDAFRQADGSATRSHGGLGLGLSIVKHLVEAHGGTVRAHSRGKDCGATFSVRIPLLAATAPERRNRRRAVIESGPMNRAEDSALVGLRVLVVDDDLDTRQVVAAQLENQHAVIRTAESAEEAFELLQHEHFDVLLADIAMPGEDGYSLIRRVRASMAGPSAATIPAAALTAFARKEDRQLALQAGFQLHLAKPVDAQALVAAVAKLGRESGAIR
jgi:signal transduction histidine kinase/ActR/RegA family two-component response regulator